MTTTSPSVVPGASACGVLPHPTAVAREMIEATVTAMPAGGAFDYVWYGRDNVNAMLASGAVLMRGCQEISSLTIGLMRDQVRESVAAGRSLSQAASLKDWIELAASLANLNVVTMTTRGIKFSELSQRILELAAEPIKGRVEATVRAVPGLA